MEKAAIFEKGLPLPSLQANQKKRGHLAISSNSPSFAPRRIALLAGLAGNGDAAGVGAGGGASPPSSRAYESVSLSFPALVGQIRAAVTDPQTLARIDALVADFGARRVEPASVQARLCQVVGKSVVRTAIAILTGKGGAAGAAASAAASAAAAVDASSSQPHSAQPAGAWRAAPRPRTER